MISHQELKHLIRYHKGPGWEALSEKELIAMVGIVDGPGRSPEIKGLFKRIARELLLARAVVKAAKLFPEWMDDAEPEMPADHFCGPESNCDALCMEHSAWANDRAALVDALAAYHAGTAPPKETA